MIRKIILIALVMMALPMNAQDKKKKKVKVDKVKIIYFAATWCAPCKDFRKERKTEEMKAVLAHAKLTKVDIDYDKRGLAQKYNIKSVPAFVKLDKKNNVVGQLSGMLFATEKADKRYAQLMFNLIQTDLYDLKK